MFSITSPQNIVQGRIPSIPPLAPMAKADLDFFDPLSESFNEPIQKATGPSSKSPPPLPLAPCCHSISRCSSHVFNIKKVSRRKTDEPKIVARITKSGRFSISRVQRVESPSPVADEIPNSPKW